MFFVVFWVQLAYLPDRKKDYILDDDVGSLDSSEFSVEGKFDANNLDDPNSRFDKRNRKRGMLSWLKMKVRSCIFCA